MNKKITTKEIVVVAMVAAVVGVIYTLLDYAYMPMSAVSAVSSGRRFRGSWSRDSICYFQA